jgi:hypothetical protein
VGQAVAETGFVKMGHAMDSLLAISSLCPAVVEVFVTENTNFYF